MTYLSEAIASMVHGMQSLDLSQCSITSKGVIRLMDGVSKNHIMPNTLHTLNLSGNTLKGEELLVSRIIRHSSYDFSLCGRFYYTLVKS